MACDVNGRGNAGGDEQEDEEDDEAERKRRRQLAERWSKLEEDSVRGVICWAVVAFSTSAGVLPLSEGRATISSISGGGEGAEGHVPTGNRV